MDFPRIVDQMLGREKRKSELRGVSLGMLDDNALIDFKTNNTRDKIEKALNNIKDIEELEEISELIGALTDNLNKLLIAQSLDIRNKAIIIARRKIVKIKEALGVQLVIVNNIL
jgi:DNA polymerase III gamma/tau subunit